MPYYRNITHNPDTTLNQPLPEQQYCILKNCILKISGVISLSLLACGFDTNQTQATSQPNLISDHTFTVIDTSTNEIKPDTQTVNHRILYSSIFDNSSLAYLKGINYLYGTDDVSRDYALAYQWLQHAASLGSKDAILALGFMYDNGLGVKQDTKQAMIWYKKAANYGSSEAMHNLGLKYYRQQDFDTAKYWFTEAAKLGNTDSMYNLGAMSNFGVGQAVDDQNAYYWFDKAAKAGNARAMHHLAYRYRRGLGTPKDDKQFIKWLTQAAQSGYVESMYQLGYFYLKGHVVEQSDSKAFYWFMQAAKAGEAASMNNVGALYERGQGVGKNDNQALCWYIKAYEAELIQNNDNGQGKKTALKNITDLINTGNITDSALLTHATALLNSQKLLN